MIIIYASPKIFLNELQENDLFCADFTEVRVSVRATSVSFAENDFCFCHPLARFNF